MNNMKLRFAVVTILWVGLASAAVNAGTPDFETIADRHKDTTVADRRHLHTHPELSGREVKTQAYLRERITEIPGIEMIEGDWGTGLVAILRGAHKGPLIAWRADTDGLPITETTDLPFASTCRDTLSGGRNVGVMHGCGHDIHMSVALGAMRILSDLRQDMTGDVLWIIQPAEEIGQGAADMLEAGVFADGREPRCVLALHDHPTVEYGKIGICSGWSSANVDGFRLTVHGQGGHGAYPHRSIDPVTLASRMVLALNDMVAREIDVQTPAVISVGSIHGGTKSNVIPDAVVIEATVRTRDNETRALVRDKIKRTVMGLATATGAPAPDLDYHWGTPSGYNDPGLSAEVIETASRVLGKDNVVTYPPGMGGEDFSRYGRVVPGVQFRLGVGRPDRPMTLHNSDFDPDERSVGLGMRLVAEILWDQLQHPAARH